MHLSAATRTWTNGAGTGNWGDGGNWTGGAVPGLFDVALFDGTSNANCTVNTGVNVQGVQITVGYTGTITQGTGQTITVGTLILGGSGFAQAGGTFIGSNAGITINGAAGFNLSGGSFTSTSASLTLGGLFGANATLFTHSGGTFNHNNGTVVFQTSSTGCTPVVYTADVLTNTLFYNVQVSVSALFCASYAVFSTTAGDTVDVANDLTVTDGQVNGLLQFARNLTIGTSVDGGSGRLIAYGSAAQQYTVNTPVNRTCELVVNKSAGALAPAAGTTDLSVVAVTQLSGDLTAPSGNLNVGGTLTSSRSLFTHSGGTFTHNNGTLVVQPFCNTGSQLTWTIDVLPTTSFYDVTINSSYGWVMPVVATAAGDVVNATDDLTHTDGYITGQFAVKGDLNIGAGADGGTGTITVDGTVAQRYMVAAGSPRTCQVVVNKSAGAFTPNAGTTDLLVQSFSLQAGSFTAPSGSLNVGGTWSTSQTLFSHSGGTFTHNNGTLVVQPYCNVGSQLTWTIDVLPVTTLYDVTINSTHGWVMPVVTTAAGDVVNATNDLTHTDGYIIGQFAVKRHLIIGAGADGGTGTITVDGTVAQRYTVAAGSPRTCQVVVNKSAGAFTPNAGTTDLLVQSFSLQAGSFTAPSGSLNVGGTWSSSQTLFSHSGGTYTHNNGILVVQPYCNVGSQLTWTLDVIPATTLYDVVINSTHGWVMPVVATAAGDVVTANNDLTHTDGYISGQFAVKRNLIINAGSDGGIGTITVNGTGAQQYFVAAGSPRTCQVVVNKSAGACTPGAGTTDLLVQSFSLQAGAFTAPSGSLNVGGTWSTSQTLFAHSGGTYTHNSGTLVVQPYCNVGSQLTWSIDVLPVTTLYDVTINSTHGWVMPVVATAAGDVVNATNDLTHTDGYIIGQFAVKRHLSIGAGADGGTGTITVDGTVGQQYFVAAGSPRTCQVVVNKSAGSFTPGAGTVDLPVQAFLLQAGDFTAPSGNLSVGGTWSVNQTLFGHTGGTYAHNNGTLVVNPYTNSGGALTFNLDVIPATVLNNLTISFTTAWTLPTCVIPAGDSIEVDGLLHLVDGRVNTGAFQAFGPVTVGAGYDGGNAQLVFAGSAAQQFDLTGATGRYDGDIRLAKTMNNVTLSSGLLMDAVSQDLLFTKGDLITTAANLLILGDNVTAVGASDSSFVDGPMRKVGDEAFWFPVGDADTAFAPIRVNNTAVTTNAWTAEYFHVDPDAVPFDVTLKDITLDHISRCEYWSLERTTGSSNVAVSLSWAPRSCGVTNIADLHVARWTGALWRDHGNGGTTGSTTAGTIVTAGTVSSFTYFTLASGTLNNPLPIELVRFEAIARPDHVDLQWVTASESNNDHFVVERTRDGVAFEEVVMVPGAGNSSALLTYTDIDADPLPGLSYYRLVQVDLDGTATYSDLVPVRYDTDEHSAILVYPNPTDGSSAWLVMPEGLLQGHARLMLSDATGRVVMVRDLELTGTTGRIDLLGGADLRSGAYTVHLQAADAERSTRLIVQ